jgi:hypothetical protein
MMQKSIDLSVDFCFLSLKSISYPYPLAFLKDL